MSATAFYSPEGDGFRAAELTRGPWDPGSQHGGPPCALIGREIELNAGTAFRVARVTFEILGPVPIGLVEVTSKVVRPGRTVELVEAVLRAGGRDVILARAWRIRTGAVEGLESPGPDVAGERIPGPDQGHHLDFFPTGQDVGFHTAMENRYLEGTSQVPGPAKVWMRMLHPLVPGEEPSPLVRTLIAADSGNGVASPLDYRRYVFINTDLSVTLHRHPEGEWVLLDAATEPGEDGIGMTVTRLHDQRGSIGIATQALVVRARPQ